MRIVQASARLAARGMARRGGVAVAALTIGLAMAGCQGAGGSSGQAGGQQITVATVPSDESAPLQVGVNQGFFSQRGITVTVRAYHTIQQAYAALRSGQAQVISGDYADLLYQANHDSAHPLRLIADGYDATSGVLEVLTLTRSGITSPQQLQNRRVGTPPSGLIPFSHSTPYNTETLATDAVLQGDGVSPSSIHWVPMPLGNMISALRSHQVDAIVAPEPYILQAESGFGALELLDSFSGVAANLPISGYFTTASYANSHAGTLRGFQAALSQAQASSAQRGVIQPMIRVLPGMDAQEAALVTLGQYPTFLSSGQIQRVADLMFSSGVVRNAIAVKPLIFH
jgi:NitT/TauT family transport system substrate-binding protein